MKVLLTGGRGMLGRTICRVLGDRFERVPTDLPEADITDEEYIDRVIAAAKPDAVIHCAAATAVDACEGKIDVLLATYRPDQTLLKAQIDSIRSQTGVEMNLMCREDVAGLGACGNFAALLRESKSEYVAFSDQDDVWCPEKLAKCLAKLHELETRYGRNTPLMVFCDGFVTDASLNEWSGTVISRQHVDVVNGLAFNRLLMQNFIAGNAMLLNAALREKAGAVPSEALMHDIWLALVAAAFGHIGFVGEPLYRYRQHGANVLGATEAGGHHFASRAKEGVVAFRRRLAENAAQAQAFADRFGDETPVAARALAALPRSGWLKRRLLILRHRLWKHGFVRNLALIVCV